MFDSLPIIPPDPIFGLMDQYRSDRRVDKVNLTIGTFQDEHGNTPVLKSVRQAEQQILQEEKTKTYLRIAGLNSFNQLTAELLLGQESPAIAAGRFCTLQTPGGTGALRIVAEFLAAQKSNNRIWIGRPTWVNHISIFERTGVAVETFDYLTPSRNRLDFEGMVEVLSRIPEGDCVLLHTVCHNPSGVDPQTDQWEIIFGLLRERRLLPIFDFAYQGFKESIDADAFPIRRLVELGCELLICSSCSKNFGLYGERVGAVTGICRTAQNAKSLSGCLESIIRGIYSNPPKHGAGIVAAILADSNLRAQWHLELDRMRQRIRDMRCSLADEMEKQLGGDQYGFLRNQHGMFSFIPLQPEQVDTLRNDFAIYLLRSGRINVAGLTEANLPRVCRAIADVSQHVAN